jgi:hypothetical protein
MTGKGWPTREEWKTSRLSPILPDSPILRFWNEQRETCIMLGLRSPMSTGAIKAWVRWRNAGRVTPFLVSLALAVFFSIASGKDQPKKPWLQKDWTQWTQQDCKSVLEESPWVYYWFASDYGTLRKTAQLRSALPIREALLRQQQLEQRYDKMKPAQKQAFDQQHSGDLTASDDTPILLYVDHYRYDPLPKEGSRAVGREPGPDPGRRVAIKLSNGTLVTPTETTQLKVDNTVWENAYLYAFPRIMDGTRAFTTADNEIFFVFGEPLPMADKEGRIAPQRAEDFHAWTQELEEKDVKTKRVLKTIQVPRGYMFKIADMMYKGKLEY